MSMIIRVFNKKMRLKLVAVGLGMELGSVQESKLDKTTINHTLRGRHSTRFHSEAPSEGPNEEPSKGPSEVSNEA